MLIYDNNYDELIYYSNRGETVIGIKVPVVDIEPHAIKYLIT